MPRGVLMCVHPSLAHVGNSELAQPAHAKCQHSHSRKQYAEHQHKHTLCFDMWSVHAKGCLVGCRRFVLTRTPTSSTQSACLLRATSRRTSWRRSMTMCTTSCRRPLRRPRQALKSWLTFGSLHSKLVLEASLC